MPGFVFGLVSAAFMSSAAAGPPPRDASTNKPSAEACAAARAANRNLPGCDQPDEGELDEARGEQGTSDGGRPGFIICPGDARCPRR